MAATTAPIKDRIKQLHDKQLENYKFVQERSNMKKSDVINRIKERQELAMKIVQNKLQERVFVAAKKGESEAAKLASIEKRAQMEAKDHVIKTYLVALEERYREKQVQHNTQNMISQRVLMARKATMKPVKKTLAEKQYLRQKAKFHKIEQNKTIKDLDDLKAGLEESIIKARMVPEKYSTSTQ